MGGSIVGSRQYFLTGQSNAGNTAWCSFELWRNTIQGYQILGQCIKRDKLPDFPVVLMLSYSPKNTAFSSIPENKHRYTYQTFFQYQLYKFQHN